jgi:hypothetical protein
MSPQRIFGFAVLVIPILVGCQPTSPGQPAAKLDCEIQGYPCSLARAIASKPPA